MTIEFPCPQCAQLVRTPDAAAGKKGKCPSCGTVVRIPGAAAAPPPPQPAAPQKATPKPTPTKSPAKSPAPPPAATQPTEAPETGPIEFFCSLCGKLVTTPRAAAGKKGKCPGCQGVILIPLKSRKVLPGKSPPQTTSAQPTSAPTQKSLPQKPQPKPAPPPKQPDEIGMAPLDELPPLEEPPPKKIAAKIKTARPQSDRHAAAMEAGTSMMPGGLPTSKMQPTDLDGPLPDLAPIGNDPFADLTPLSSLPSLTDLTPLPTSSLPPAGSFGPNPYQSPQGMAPAPRPKPGGDPAVILIPAICQLVAVLPFLGLNIFIIVSMVTVLMGLSEISNDPRVNPQGVQTATAWVLFYLLCAVVALICQGWIIVGSIKMMMRRDYSNAQAAAWMSVIPCFGCFGIPFGIWSLIVLNQDHVRRSFRE